MFIKYKFMELIKTVDSVHTCKPLKRLDLNFIQILHFFQKYKIFILIYHAAGKSGSKGVTPLVGFGATPHKKLAHRRFFEGVRYILYRRGNFHQEKKVSPYVTY